MIRRFGTTVTSVASPAATIWTEGTPDPDAAQPLTIICSVAQAATGNTSVAVGTYDLAHPNGNMDVNATGTSLVRRNDDPIPVLSGTGSSVVAGVTSFGHAT